HSSRRQHDRMQRVARGGPATTWKNAARWRLPLLPPMNGVGAIVWRQLTTAIRTSTGLLFVLALILIAVAGFSTSIDPEKQHIALAALTGPGVFFTFFLITMTRFDFRND